MTDEATFLLVAAPIMERTRNFYGHAAQEQYKCFFGVAAHVTVILWRLLHENALLGTLASSMEPKHLLWTLYFLRNYPSNRIHAAQMNADSTTVRRYIWEIINAMAELTDYLVSEILLFVSLID